MYRQTLPPLPSPAAVQAHVQTMLDRDSLEVGVEGRQDRLMMMMTRSCELRCSYCFVRLTEEAYGQDFDGTFRPNESAIDTDPTPLGDMPMSVSRQSIDWLLKSSRDRLGLQLFGGEPARRWDTLVETLHYLKGHPERRNRPVEVLFTTNGLGLQMERLEEIEPFEVRIQFSLDGDARASRFRRGHLLNQQEVNHQTEAAIDALIDSGVGWFMNATLPPASSDEVFERYLWARSRGVPAFQINYVTGMSWTESQMASYLSGIQQMLVHHHEHPEGFHLFNWFNQADPVPLCGDIIVDVDGQIYQVGALFHEKRSPELRKAYHLGHVADPNLPFTDTRLTLSELARRTREALSHKERQADIFFQNVRLGAAVDLMVQELKDQLGKSSQS